MGVCQKMTQDDKGEVGVWNGPKKDDVIYEQPLTYHNITLPLHPVMFYIFPQVRLAAMPPQNFVLYNPTVSLVFR